jgi:hypothetical protein
VDLQSEKGIATKNSVVGNVFIEGPSKISNSLPLYLRTKGTYTLISGSRVYVKDNYAAASNSTAISNTVQFTGGDIISGLLQTSTVPTWNTGIKVLTTANNSVYNSVLRYAGARPYGRDSVDIRIVNHVKQRNGLVINCVATNGSERCKKSAGGWPYYSKNTRRLTLPANPSTTTSNGYTNLENWLHDLDDNVQGLSTAESPAAPLSLSVR